MTRYVLLLFALMGVTVATAQPPEPDALRDRLEGLRPAREGWQEIAWHTELGEARQEADRQRRPLFIWAMNGNPLGCT